MAKGEIVILEEYCTGCGYCVEFCNRGCIATTVDKFNSKGYLLPTFAEPEKCNACGVCSWMCPSFAIEVYKLAESAPKS